MYVAVKGGEAAIKNAHKLLAKMRRGDDAIDELSTKQLEQQMPLAVSRVMSEGALYDPALAALALKQSAGDLVEAIFLLRAYRTTLPRYGFSEALESADMRLERRVSATYKDLPGGQILGPTFDYTHRLLNFKLAAENRESDEAVELPELPELDAFAYGSPQEPTARVVDLLKQQDLIQLEPDNNDTPADLTHEPLQYPANRSMRLQALARGDEGFLTALGYSTQRGYARNHPFAGEIRMGWVEMEFYSEELGDTVCVGEMQISECTMINQFVGDKNNPPQFTQGYGLSFGFNERKTMAMALVDRALRCEEFDEAADSPAQDQEFVLSHCDVLDASGFVSHLKLPHYVDFQSELELIRTLRQKQSMAEEPAHDRFKPI